MAKRKKRKAGASRKGRKHARKGSKKTKGYRGGKIHKITAGGVKFGCYGKQVRKGFGRKGMRTAAYCSKKLAAA
jgi:hypothetical protein